MRIKYAISNGCIPASEEIKRPDILGEINGGESALRGNSQKKSFKLLFPAGDAQVRAESESLTAEVRQTVWSVNRSLPITELRTMKDIYDRSMARTSFTLSLLAISGVMALLLAVVGIYAVISYTVAQKTREIGIRMALGAQQGSLKRMFVLRGLLWSGIGAAAGLAAVIGLSRLMAALLFDASPFDTLTYLAPTLGILAEAAAASYLPALRIRQRSQEETLSPSGLRRVILPRA